MSFWSRPSNRALWQKGLMLLILYFVQGLPFGFQVHSLPILLRIRGAPLSAIGLVNLLAAPWALKACWSPLIDRFFSSSFGKRKSWIVPTQLGIILCCTAASRMNLEDKGFYFTLLTLNLFSATQDIAVDGLAVDMLRSDQEVSVGNTAQVVGFKLGLVSGGVILAWTQASIAGYFVSSALFVGFVLLLTLFYNESEPVTGATSGAPTLKMIFWHLRSAMVLPGSARGLLLVFSYKSGECIVKTMFKPFLVDHGFTLAQLGVWNGLYGMIFSICGSLLGGLLASRVTLATSLALTTAFRTIPLAIIWGLGAGVFTISEFSVIGCICLEGILGGALTTVMFSWMMAQVDPRVGATHYTALATIEVLGKSLSSAFSGLLAEFYGFSILFAFGTCLSLVPVGLSMVLKFHPVARRASPN